MEKFQFRNKRDGKGPDSGTGLSLEPKKFKKLFQHWNQFQRNFGTSPTLFPTLENIRNGKIDGSKL